MMCKSKSALTQGFRALYVIPLVAVALSCNSRTVAEVKVSEISEKLEGIQLELKEASAGEYVCTLNGENILFDEICDKVGSALTGDDKGPVVISAPAGVSCGVIEDIKDNLRNIEDITVRFKCTDLESTETAAGKIPERPKTMTSPTGVEVWGTTDIKNSIIIKINDNDKVLFESTPIDLNQVRDMVIAIKRSNHKAEFYYQHDRRTSFGAYVSAQRDIAEGVRTVRDEYAQEQFGKAFDELDENESQEVITEIPLNVYEAEPRSAPRPQ